MKNEAQKIVFAVFILIICFGLNAQRTLTDIDDNVYNTVTIGMQKWMKENLKSAKYSNGDSITNITDAAEWIILNSGAFSNYNNDSDIVAVHGRLYNGYTVIDNRNLCPSGWHVPTDDDWTILTDFLGGETVSGGKMKETGTVHWNSPNTGASNSSGFTALPSGGRMYTDGSYQYIGEYGGWWSSTEQADAIHIKYRNISYQENSVGNYSSPKQFGFSVRCMEDPIPDSAKYFGQILPGETAIIFAPGIVSLSDRGEDKITFSPDGKECFFNTGDGMYYMKYVNNNWTSPVIAPLTLSPEDQKSTFSKDGNRLYFTRFDADYTTCDIGYFERTFDGWSDPVFPPSPFNTSSWEFDYTEDNDGIAYIASNRSGNEDIWRIQILSDQSIQAENLGSIVNSGGIDFSPCVAPDGSYLIFATTRNGDQDLYICFSKENNEWTKPINMNSGGAKVNFSGYWEKDPSLSPDGKYLFFNHHASSRDTIDIFWVSTSIIDDLKEIAFATSVAETKRAQIQVFPNPTAQALQIKGIDMLLNKATYQLSNLTGKTIQQGKLNAETIDISGLPKGIYLLSLNTSEGIITEKIIIK